MNRESFEMDLPEALDKMIQEIETYCGFEIRLEYQPRLEARGKLKQEPLAMTIQVRTLPVKLAVLTHELCHARRFYNRKVWQIEFIPIRYYGQGKNKAILSENLDNQIEHLFILKEMEEEFGIAKDDSNLISDLDALAGSEDRFFRKLVLLTAWLAADLLFPLHKERVFTLLVEEGLLEEANELLREVKDCWPSKAEIVAAVTKALQIPADEVQLRRREPAANGRDIGAMLNQILEDERSVAGTGSTV